MYQRKSGLQGMIVLVLDCLCILLSLMIGNYIRNEFWFYNLDRVNFGFFYTVCVLLFLAINLFHNIYKKMHLRGPLDEFFCIVANNLMLLGGVTIVLYFLKVLDAYSRMVFVYFIVLSTLFMFVVHQIWKAILPYLYEKFWETRKLLLITDKANAEDAVKNVKSMMDFSYELFGCALLDGGQEDKQISGIPVVTDKKNLLEFCRNASLDEVLIAVESVRTGEVLADMEVIAQMGIAIHYRINVPELKEARRKVLSQFGGYQTVTYAHRFVPVGQVLLKRIMDICGALFGCVILALLTVTVGPLIKLESPGPIFFSQKRVGRNGRIFKMYKFRSMYADAEARKKELMSQNEMSGLMFKMENDPRITKIGKFLRKTSLDEFPQFINILMGDMSLVGTRPPTLDEFVQYSPYHKKRLSFRPGLTGMWQVSGRSDITDFEEIVRLDVEYIDDWSIGLDIKILLKTVMAVFAKDGAR
ncbi:MAG: sugar transferase [Lachnospiraceae bacterium]|nr:sugar transferase [Lachnospiraceae bacterium]